MQDKRDKLKMKTINLKMKQMMKVMIVLMIALLTSGTIFSQAPAGMGSGPGGMSAAPKLGKLTGKIIDAETKTPMEYANISVFRKQDSKLVTGTIANEAGSFELSELPFGAFYIEAAFIGFEKTTINEVKIIPNSTVVDLGTIELNVSRLQIGSVDVISERNRIEYKIDKKVINVSNDINAAGGTAVTVLENTPSVEVDIDGNVSLRGSSSFTVLIDGRPSVLSGSDALKQIPSSAIENIEIITNPSVKYDPDGMAGIINIVMKKNVLAGVNGIINLNLGTGDKYGTDITLNYKTKKYNLFLGGNWNDETNYGDMQMTRETYSNGITTFLDTKGRRDMIRGGSQLKAGLDYYLTDKTTLTVSSEIGDYKHDNSGGGNLHSYTLPASKDIFSVQDNLSSRNGNYISANANFQTKFDENGMHKLEGSFNYSFRDGISAENIDETIADASFRKTTDFLSRVITNENSTDNSYRFKLDYTLPLADGSRFEAGLQSRIEREVEDFNFKNYDPVTKNFVNNSLFTSDMDFKEDVHAIYSTYSGKLSVIKYQLGLRGELTDRSILHSKTNNPYTLNRFDVFPSAHFSYDLANQDQIMVSYSKRVNRPDGRDLDPFPNYMNQYTIRIGNPDLKPEFTDSYELSFMKKFGNSFLSVETFYRSTNDLMTRIQELKDGVLYMTTDNLNKDHSLGGEIMGNLNITKWLLINTSFSVYNYKLEGEILGKSIDRESTNYSGRINSTIKFSPDSRLQLTGFYRGPSVSAQGDMKSMIFTNLAYRHEFMKKKLSATLSVRDLFATGKFEGSSSSSDFKSTFKMQREPRVVMLTLSYKINNFKSERPSAPQEQPGQGMNDMF